MCETVQRAAVLTEVARQLESSRRRRISEGLKPGIALTIPQWHVVEAALRAQADPGQRNHPESNLIDGAQPSAGFMVQAAVRYCLGRPKNAPCLCTNWLRGHWHDLPKPIRADILRDVERYVTDEAQGDGESLHGPLRPWREFLAWVRVGQEVPERREALAPMARYRLEILARGPRTYSPTDPQIQALHRRGLIEPLTQAGAGERDRWAITRIGRAALGTAPHAGTKPRLRPATHPEEIPT
jgi:hypothetical protein